MAFLRWLCVLVCAICSAAPAFAAVVGFDDLNATAGDIVLDTMNPYQGFTWMNFTVYTTTPGFPGFNNGIVSSPNASFAGGDILGAPVVSTIRSPTPFDFTSASLGSGWYDGLSVTVIGKPVAFRSSARRSLSIRKLLSYSALISPA